jgi:hypothetical protein
VPPAANVAPCSAQTVGASRRAFCDVSDTFAEATARCAAFGGALARIENAAANNAITNIGEDIFATAWIGANDVDGNGVWKWLDGAIVPTPYSSWEDNEPDGALNENCVAMADTGNWADVSCTQPRGGYVCETPQLIPMPVECSGFARASDQLVICALETAGEEVARTACEDMFGALVVITSQAENDDVQALVPAGELVFLGGSDAAAEGTWRWLGEEVFDVFP